MDEVSVIFDALAKSSALIIKQDKIRAKTDQIRSVESKTCGNCCYWMTSSCVPEKKYGQFKSAKSCACKDFNIRSYSVDLSERFKLELKALENK